MEGPVLTTPSSQRLRSAVGACAQSPHSYFGSSSYLGARIQCGAHNSGGGCIKKFHCFGKNVDSTVFDKLNLTKKGGPVGKNEIGKNGCRKTKTGGKTCLNQYCGFRSVPIRVQAESEARKQRRNGRKGETLPGAEPYDAYSAQFAIKNDVLSKVTLNRGTGSLLGCPGTEGFACEDAVRKCEKGPGGGYSSGSESDLCGGVGGKATGRNGSAKLLNYCTKNRNKVKRKNFKKNGEGGGGGGGVLLYGKNGGIVKEKIGDDCYNCGGRENKSIEEVKNERQEISKWQPKHAVTRRTAQIVRKIRNAWEKRVGASRLVAAENVQLLFNDLQLFVSTSQVAEMLKCAQECSKNTSSKHLTFGEFYKIANDLMRAEITSASPSPRVFEENVEKRRGKVSRGMSKYEVFLGGSCNPTTWRTDLAIPELKNMNITYYNPVEEWRPELLEVEYQAKENATVMFFVIDNQTRGVSALIEVAHLAGNERKLILVIQLFTQKNQIISNEEISHKECEDLKMGQEVLQDLVQKQKIPVFNDIKDALKSTEKILRENIRPQDLQEGNRIAENEDSMRPQDIFDEFDQEKTGKILLREACLALKLLRRQNVTLKRLETSLKTLENNSNGVQLDSDKVDFVSFTKLIDLFERQQQQQKHHEGQAGSCPAGSSFPASPSDSLCDVYLGGTLENTNWRQSIAIPMLTSENLRYFAPKVREGKKEFTDVEAIAMENSFALLFVITNTARSIAAMAIAGHYIGRGANVVLCVQNLAEGARVGGETLTDRAVKDYNRGRMYLTDIAKRMGVEVFDEISDAVRFVIDKCKMAALASAASAVETNSISSMDAGQE